MGRRSELDGEGEGERKVRERERVVRQRRRVWRRESVNGGRDGSRESGEEGEWDCEWEGEGEGERKVRERESGKAKERSGEEGV